MTPFYADDWLTVYGGDCREVLASLPSDSVDCVVTSPPYWGLRDYGTATWVGGDEACDHKAPPKGGPHTASTLGPKRDGLGPDNAAWAESKREHQYAQTCGKCGATRIDSQLGLERTPEEYVANMVSVFRAVRRVLKPSGTCWLNLGDSYSGAKGDTYSGFNERYRGKASVVDKQAESGRARVSAVRRESVRGVPRSSADHGDRLKPKELVGIPWRVAFALQADGWYLRSDIIWSKPNPMPESVTDRPTKSHEMVFLLTKSARYYFDAEAVRERVGVSGIVEAANGNHKRLVFGQDLGLHGASTDPNAVGIRLAAAILDRAGGQDELRLSSLDPQIGEQGAGDSTRSGTVGDPIMRRAAAEAAWFADGDVAAKEFLSEMDRLCIALPDGHDLKELRIAAGLSASAPVPLIDPDRDAPVAVDDAGEVGQIEGIHHKEYTSERTPRPRGHARPHEGFNGRWDDMTKAEQGANGRNIRSVWIIATRPYPGAHFAVFPPELPERCIKAGSSERGVCPECGAPWERVVERERIDTRPGNKVKARSLYGGNAATTGRAGDWVARGIDWRKSCPCPAVRYNEDGTRDIVGLVPVPAVVLDPFAGSGTVGMVANRLSRRAILIDLNPEYLRQQMARNAQTPLGLTEGDAA